jgi:hypothetical protein
LNCLLKNVPIDLPKLVKDLDNVLIYHRNVSSDLFDGAFRQGGCFDRLSIRFDTPLVRKRRRPVSKRKAHA